MSNRERQEVGIELPERIAGVQHTASLSSTINGQVQEQGLTPDDISLISNGAVRTAKTITRGTDSTDSLMGFEIERASEDVYRFRYQRPIHNAVRRDGGYHERQDTVRVGPVLEGQLRDEGGRASEIILFDVRKYS